MGTYFDLVKDINWHSSLITRLLKWLFETSYWQGYLNNKEGKLLEPLRGNDLEYVWAHWNGLRIHIQSRDREPFYSTPDLGSFSFEGRYPFTFKLIDRGESISAYDEIKSCFEDIEKTIEKFFPGIHQVNTWGLCEYQISTHCQGRDNTIEICKNLGGKKICNSCEDENGRLGVKADNATPNKIYIIGSTERGLYKIGVSSKPRSRFKAIKTELPFPVEILHTINADNMYEGKKKLHTWFKHRHTHGEWFELSNEEFIFCRAMLSFKQGNFIDKDGKTIQRDSKAI